MIGLDIGTSAVKALLASEAGWVAGARRGYHLDIGPGGRVEVDAEVVWAAARSAIRALAARARAEECSVIAVCAGGSGDEAVWLDARGAAVAPIPMALDTRSEADGAAFVATVGEARFAARTLLPPAGTYPLVRLIWLRQVAPRLAADVRLMLAWPEFIAVRLGAEPAAEPSLAARSAAFDPRSGGWDSELLTAAGIDSGTFPRIVPTGSVVGTIGPAFARRLGLADGALIVAGGFDQAMATLGAGATTSRVAHLGLGSWQAITILCERPDPSWSARGISCGPAIGARVGWSAMASSAGGAAMAWLGGLAGSRGGLAGSRGGLAGRVAAVARRARDVPTGVIVLPDIHGAGPPRPDPAARGAIAGLGLAVDAAILARALLEGIAMDLADQIGVLAGGTAEIDEVRISGAGGRDRVAAQLRADIIGRPVRSIAPLDAGPTAAAALALAAALPGRSVEAAMAAMLELGPTIEPRLDHHRAYREIGQQRRRLRADLGGSRPAAVERVG